VFTGIVEETSTVVQAGTRMRVRVNLVAGDADVGASIAVSGVCLTVVEREEAEAGVVVGFDLADETLARTSLGRLRAGDRVNLERPLAAGARLGGHLVQGHVDGVGVVTDVRTVQTGREVEVRLPGDLARFVAEKGSVAVDGVSLTVTGVAGPTFGVALIPFTLEATTLGERVPGDEVNVEVDVVARYLERLLPPRGHDAIAPPDDGPGTDDG
jgi:riboflavin synthase